MAIRNSFKGWSGEILLQFSMWLFLDSKVYRRIHNVIIEDQRGSTQIDHVIVSRYGLFVIEMKNMSGWIFGNESDKQWTQKFYRRSFKFQNPIRQNFRHCKALAETLEVSSDNIHSIVYFGLDAELKTTMPANVMNGGLIRYLHRFTSVVWSDEETALIEKKLREKKLIQISNKTHVENLRKTHNSAVCAHCGGNLVERPGKFGSFFGCEHYPKCRYTRPA